MKRLLPAILLLCTGLVKAQSTSIGIFQQHADIGGLLLKAGCRGIVTRNPTNSKALAIISGLAVMNSIMPGAR